MIKIGFIFISTFLFTKVSAQVKPDSIQKNSLLRDYELIKITEYNREVFLDPARKTLSFSILTEQAKVDYYKQKYKLNVAVNDTIVLMEWDVEKKTGNSTKLPDAGLFKLTDGSKVTIKKSRMSPENKRVIVERKFKIFKWNETALILQDISDPDVNRVYTFKR